MLVTAKLAPQLQEQAKGLKRKEKEFVMFLVRLKLLMVVEVFSKTTCNVSKTTCGASKTTYRVWKGALDVLKTTY